MLTKVHGLVTAGLKWFTTGRKRRGVLTAMQGMLTLNLSFAGHPCMAFLL